MSFFATFATNLAMNLISGSGKGGARGQAAPVQRAPQLNLGGYKRAVGRRGSQATKSRAAPVQMAPGVTADSIAKMALSRMLRETKDKVKQAKVMKA